jgi:hypothetical protein
VSERRSPGADVSPEAIDEPDEIEDAEPARALLVAIARDRLDEARAIEDASGSVAVGVRRTDDLEAVSPGMPVLIYAFEPGRRVSSVTWCATFAAVVEEAPPGAIDLPAGPPPAPEDGGGDLGDVPDPDPDDDEERAVAYVVLRDIAPLPDREHIATNELVPKQQRGARFFMPRDPRLVHLPP